MLAVLNCITGLHNIWLVLLAALVCSVGAWATLRLFRRVICTQGLQRAGWVFLTAVAAGSSIWCTHFIAMLAYDAGVPIDFDPVLTIGSLLIAILGTAIGFGVAASGMTRAARAIGGGIVGLAISAMHYTGMTAYRVEGLVSWDATYIVASIVLAVGLASASLHFAVRQETSAGMFIATGLLAAATISLHFTGMTAFTVTPMMLAGELTNPAALQALAMAIAMVSLIIVGTGIVSYLIDDQARAESYRRLHVMAMRDALTELPNRTSFNDHCDRELGRATISGGQLAVVCIDLDNFKEVNDLKGHSAGDRVLATLARRMMMLLRDGEFVARLGGDEFAAVCRIPASARTRGQHDPGLRDFLARLDTALHEPVCLSDATIPAGASFGVACFPEHGQTRETLVNNADLALYRAKAQVKNAICFFEPSMDEAVRARKSLANDLRKAIENEELDIHYQVQRSLGSGDIQGYEALLRWQHPTRGFVSPVEFIPLAEENGLIAELGEWVLRTACARAASWKPPHKVAVNLSPVQFAHTDLPKLVHEVLLQTGLSPARLELELTESTIIADKAYSMHVLQRIKALGVSIALDDFGTGYSSLDTLRSFPFDKIKLDRSFMSEVETSPQAKAIIRAVLALGRSLGIRVLAEGIETEGQLTLLDAEGCDEGQGYFLGRPAPLRQIIADGELSLIEAMPEEAPRGTADVVVSEDRCSRSA